jgi:hypothetical protein
MEGLATDRSFNRFVVRDHRKRLIEVMKQPPPLLVLGRLAEANFVRFDRLPPHKQDVLVGPFETALKLVREVARHGDDDALSLDESSFELSGLTGADLQWSNFENHDGEPTANRLVLDGHTKQNGAPFGG